MASPEQLIKEFPTPEGSRLRDFLASCPTFNGLEQTELAQLAGELRLIRYADGTRFFNDIALDHHAPLRFVVHGRASWDSERALEQKSARMLSPGSVFGLEGLNEWALESQIDGAYDRGKLPRISSQALGPVWVLELAPDRFDAALLSEPDHPALTRLLQHVPTSVHAPDIVATMRKSAQFVRAAPMHLYKLLEWAPTDRISPLVVDPNEQEPPNQIEPGPIALYYVIEGTIRITVDTSIKTISPGELDGADLFQSPQHTVSLPRTVSQALAVVLTRDMLQTYIRLMPGFARSLGPQREKETP